MSSVGEVMGECERCLSGALEVSGCRMFVSHPFIIARTHHLPRLVGVYSSTPLLPWPCTCCRPLARYFFLGPRRSICCALFQYLQINMTYFILVLFTFVWSAWVEMLHWYLFSYYSSIVLLTLYCSTINTSLKQGSSFFHPSYRRYPSLYSPFWVSFNRFEAVPFYSPHLRHNLHCSCRISVNILSLFPMAPVFLFVAPFFVFFRRKQSYRAYLGGKHAEGAAHDRP